ncbi:hypothetical protein E8E13_005458 [Curvularia kusanoi]|uniref:Inner centromere protein ARK-binding domain-containing protein n=1 Tax=Curvularia kusanoi TaxID=90978 RepID=A0A9P4TM19_CURKU|nr:hypothetical protein E8E13_005458 [Curvularia kusanoi]
MTAARSKVPAIGSAQWILEERHQSNDLVAQELEDFGFSVRNELEWLNEHMTDIFAKDGQHNLDVFKTPGKLRGKTPHTTRKRAIIEPRQPLANLFAEDMQQRATPAEQRLKEIAQRSAVKSPFHIAEDAENEAPVQSPEASAPIARQLFSKTISDDRETPIDSFDHDYSDEASPPPPAPAHWASFGTQDTVLSSQADHVFSPPRTQTTQATQSFRYSMHDLEDEHMEGKDTAEDSFVSAIDAFAFGSNNASSENLRQQAELNDALLDEDFQEDQQRGSHGTIVHHDVDEAEGFDQDGDEDDMQDVSHFPKPPRNVSDSYSIGAETHEALDTANQRAHAPEPKVLVDVKGNDFSQTPAGPPPRIDDDDAIAYPDANEDEEMEDDEEPAPSEHSSPVKHLVRKSSLTFACLPAREPILPKKSMGRTSQIRQTGGKSLGASQIVQTVDSQVDGNMDVDEDRPALQREDPETTKKQGKTTTQRLFERFQMLEQHAPPKRISQNILSQSSRPSVYPAAPSQPREITSAVQTSQSQPSYPTLPIEPEQEGPEEEDDDDSWIAAPAKTTAPVAGTVKPVIPKSHTVISHSSPHKLKPSPIKLASAFNPDLSAAAGSTTPVGSPAGKKYADAPLSASKAKFYSALRAAKDKLIGSTTTGSQTKVDDPSSSPKRPELQAVASSDDLLGSPRRLERPISIFSHMRTPSKDSIKSAMSVKSMKAEKLADAPSSPVKERKTRSSTEREKAKEREIREKEMLHKQKSEDRLRDMREKEQSKAAAYHKKTASATISKTPSQMPSQSSLKSAPIINTASKTVPRPESLRLNAAPKDIGTDSADEMPPPPPPKSMLPTFPTTKVRPPKKLVKPTSKDALLKPQEPQKIFIKNQYTRAPPPAARTVPAATKPTISSTLGKSTSSKPTAATLSRPGTAMGNKLLTSVKSAPNTLKAPAAPKAPRPLPQAASFEKSKPQVPQARADLAAARAPTTLRTVQDANSIRVPPVNAAKPPKRAIDNDTETIQRPPKRPSQLKQNPITPGHPSQYAKGKIPGLDSARASHSRPIQPSMQYPNGDDIKLPEIMTDSEDEDSDNDFEQPSWVNTPNLREMLSTQQLMDPEAIFGPIAPLNMEQVFPNKERHKRFRERTSSAYWVHDQVTDEEKRKEREARERLVREGAWTYNPSPRPAPRAGPSH